MFEKGMKAIACKQWEAALEDYLERRLAAEPVAKLEAHLAQCDNCRQALESARLSARLLEQAAAPVAEPGPAFAPQVMARIRMEEQSGRAGGEFWRPLERLAWRVSWSAVLALLVLAAYLFRFEFSRRLQPAPVQRTEVQEIFPDSDPHPASQDEVLLTLATKDHGR